MRYFGYFGYSGREDSDSGEIYEDEGSTSAACLSPSRPLSSILVDLDGDPATSEATVSSEEPLIDLN